jgi:hypothetical protein
MSNDELLDRLNGVIDQAKFIKNILIGDNRTKKEYIKKYLDELNKMVNGLKY